MITSFRWYRDATQLPEKYMENFDVFSEGLIIGITYTGTDGSILLFNVGKEGKTTRLVS